MIYGYWLKFSGSARVFISRTVLLAVYYFILTPVAVLYRLFNDNPLKLARRSSEKSYFTHREQTFSAADLEKMW